MQSYYLKKKGKVINIKSTLLNYHCTFNVLWWRGKWESTFANGPRKLL